MPEPDDRRRRPARAAPGTVAAAGRRRRGWVLGLVSGAADNDPAAVGAFASAGAGFGTGLLWTVPVLYPMRVVAVYLASKLGQASGQGLAGLIRTQFPRWVLWTLVTAVVAGNTIQAGADLGGVASALKLLLPGPFEAWVVGLGVVILAAQWFGSYPGIRATFQWLTLALLAYVAAAVVAHPSAAELAARASMPTRWSEGKYLEMVTAAMGASVSPYLLIWQAQFEVEEDVSMGRRRLSDRRGTTRVFMRHVLLEHVTGMGVASLVMYSIMMSSAATMFPAGHAQISAAEAAGALRPLAGRLASVFFALGVVGVGMLAIPVMTVGAGYVVSEALGWKSGLTAKPADARRFYRVIAATTAAAVGMNFLGIAPMRALVGANVIQGVMAPGLLAVMMLLAGRRTVMGRWVNTGWMWWAGWATTVAMGVAAGALVWVLV